MQSMRVITRAVRVASNLSGVTPLIFSGAAGSWLAHTHIYSKYAPDGFPSASLPLLLTIPLAPGFHIVFVHNPTTRFTPPKFLVLSMDLQYAAVVLCTIPLLALGFLLLKKQNQQPEPEDPRLQDVALPEFPSDRDSNPVEMTEGRVSPMCFRITGVPLDWGEEELRKELSAIDRDLAPESIELSPLFPACNSSANSQTALLHLNSETEYFRGLKQKGYKYHSFTNQGEKVQLKIDKNFYGLTPLSKPAADAPTEEFVIPQDCLTVR
jgi:hypothetical protein